ncbi:MAG TPA: hypothetical protein VFE84_00275, partial [Patescibacteria group bacterium]|nr:hypothetical protein [Patescibacteria group bacterium]
MRAKTAVPLKVVVAFFLVLLVPSQIPASDSPVAPASATDALDQSFAQILKLEDRRSRGGDDLAGFLDKARPLAVRVRAALAVGRIGAPVTTPYDLIGA